MEKNQLFIIHGKDYQEMTKRLLEKSGLDLLIGDRKRRITLKPNLVSPSDPSYGATTHREVLAGIIEYLQERGFADITMMESSWAGARTEDAFDVAGYRELVERYHIPFQNMKKEKAVKTNCAGMELSICKKALETDFLINVPVLKGHGQTRITCALKNMKGLIPDSEKRRFHSLGLHKPIAHLNTAIRQDFIVVDNICGDLDFEDGGNPVPMDRVIAGRDPVLVDAYVCNLLHYEVDEVPYIRMAEKLGVGMADLKKADICYFGSSQDISLARPKKVVEISDHVTEIESCSACYGSLLPALDRLRNEGLLDRLPGKICIGQGFRNKAGDIGIGHCTAGFKRHLEGCPPDEEKIYVFLKMLAEQQ